MVFGAVFQGLFLKIDGDLERPESFCNAMNGRRWLLSFNSILFSLAPRNHDLNSFAYTV